MSTHVFGGIITANGIAANNRGENEGNITTLQKVLWNDQVHTTVSSEAIRWAIRYYWQTTGQEVNRVWNDETEDHEWRDDHFSTWSQKGKKTFIDDDVLGFMLAEGAKKEGGSGKGKGTTEKRRGVLEIARAVSTTPFAGDLTFNAKSGEKGRTSLYGAEVHATRYQFGFAFTPERLKDKSRAPHVLDALANLGEVAGNHSRFLFDFSPESVVLRVTDDPAPRILYCFTQNDDGSISAEDLVRRVNAGDIDASELFIGGPLAANEEIKRLKGIQLFDGVKACFTQCKSVLKKSIKKKG